MNGQEVKKRRHKLGLTRRGLAQLIGVTESSVYSWETGILPFLPNRELALETIETKLNKRISVIYPKNRLTPLITPFQKRL